jgi:hypothetical protein
MLKRMSESRAERRRKARAAERQRSDDLDEVLEGPKSTPFEAPPTGKIVDSTVEPPPRQVDDEAED